MALQKRIRTRSVGLNVRMTCRTELSLGRASRSRVGDVPGTEPLTACIQRLGIGAAWQDRRGAWCCQRARPTRVRAAKRRGFESTGAECGVVNVRGMRIVAGYHGPLVDTAEWPALPESASPQFRRTRGHPTLSGCPPSRNQTSSARTPPQAGYRRPQRIPFPRSTTESVEHCSPPYRRSCAM